MRKPLDLLYNFHWIVPGEAARSAQAYAGLLGAFLRGNGIRAAINLRGRHPNFHWWRYETATCTRLRVAHFDAMLDSRRLPLREMLVALLDAFDAAPRPLLIKCSGGQDRTSFAAALYLLHRSGWTAMDGAKAQFARFPFLHFPRKEQRWLVAFLDYASRNARGTPIADWVRQSYDPEAFAAWLRASGRAASFAGIWEPWGPKQPKQPKVRR